jgi:hypothetical protein
VAGESVDLCRGSNWADKGKKKAGGTEREGSTQTYDESRKQNLTGLDVSYPSFACCCCVSLCIHGRVSLPAPVSGVSSS